MPSTLVKLTLPFPLLAEGEYAITLSGKTAIVTIKHEYNQSGMENMTSMGMRPLGPGKLVMEPDHHGIANYAKVTVAFSYAVNPIVTDISTIPQNDHFKIVGNAKTIEDHIGPVTRECMNYLNRLVEVVRCYTGKYWIPPLSGRDIFMNSIAVSGDDGMTHQIMPLGPAAMGLYFPLQIRQESQLQDVISKALKEEEEIPFYYNLFLDAISYFSEAKFNEAIIVINIVLEAIVAEHLYRKLLEGGTGDEDAKKRVNNIFGDGLHEVMKKHFPAIDGRDFSSNEALWKKFDHARLLRKHTMHPKTRKLSEQETRETLHDIIEITNWMAGPQAKKASD